MRRHGSLILAVLAGAMFAAYATPRMPSGQVATATAAASESKEFPPTTTTTTPETTSTLPPAPATTVTTAAPVDLEAKVMSAPTGYVRAPDDVRNTGPSNLDKAVRDDGDTNARQVLTKAGFVAGYERLWTRGGNTIIDFVYLFSTSTGASDYLRHSVSGLAQGDAETTVTEFSVTGIPGAKGFLAHSTATDAAIVAFTRGAYMVQVNINGSDTTTAFISDLASRQFALAK